MTRETKVGIVVAASFVILVGGVLFVKYTQGPPPAATAPQDKATPASNNSAAAKAPPKPAPSPAQPQQAPVANNNGLPPLPGAFNEPFPPLPPLPSSNNLPQPAPVPSQMTLPGENEEQQVIRSNSSNSTHPQRTAPSTLPDMKPLPSVIPARAEEPAQLPTDVKPIPMSPPPLDLPGTEPNKPKNNDPKPASPPAPIFDWPGLDKKDGPVSPKKDGNGGGLLVPPPNPVGIEPAPMPKIDPKSDGFSLSPLPGAPPAPPSTNNSLPPMDAKPGDTPKPAIKPKIDFPMPNSAPMIPPAPDLPNQLNAVTPKPLDTAPSITPMPKPPDNPPSITPAPNHLNDLPPLPPLPLPKNPVPAPLIAPANSNSNILPSPSQPNPATIPSPSVGRSPQVNATQPNNAIQPARTTTQPQIDSYDEEWYTAQASETFATLSQKFYSDAKYAQALQQYNFDRTGLDAIRAGSTVRVPPARVLERKHGAAIPGFKPATGAAAAPPQPITRPAAMGLPQSVGDPVNFTQPSPSSGSEYTVHSSPKTLRDIAKETMGSSDKWNLIFRLNRWVNPDEPIPVDTKLRMPSDAVFTP